MVYSEILTTTTIYETVTDGTTTIPAATITSTIDALVIDKRAPEPTARAMLPEDHRLSLMARDAAADQSIGLALSSACSCLHVPLDTTCIETTAHATKTVTVEDFKDVTITETLTEGTSTVDGLSH